MNRHSMPPQAPAINRRAVRESERAEILVDFDNRPYTGPLAQSAERRRFLFNQQLRATDIVPLNEIAALRPSTPAELVLDTARIFGKHIAPDAPRRDHIAHAALAGASDIMAFLDVSTRLAAVSEEAEYEHIPPIAKKSAKTLLELASHSNELDRHLTVALGQYTTREIETLSHEELFSELRFDPKFFSLEDNVVSIDYNKRDRMRGAAGRGLDFTPRRNEILLGCPYTSRIGRLYSAMTVSAWEAGLLEQIYHEA